MAEPTRQEPSRRLLKAEEAACYLGIGPRTLWSMTNSGELPSVRFGAGRRKSVRYDLDDLDRWIASHKRGGAV